MLLFVEYIPVLAFIAAGIVTAVLVFDVVRGRLAASRLASEGPSSGVWSGISGLLGRPEPAATIGVTDDEVTPPLAILEETSETTATENALVDVCVEGEYDSVSQTDDEDVGEEIDEAKVDVTELPADQLDSSEVEEDNRYGQEQPQVEDEPGVRYVDESGKWSLKVRPSSVRVFDSSVAASGREVVAET